MLSPFSSSAWSIRESQLEFFIIVVNIVIAIVIFEVVFSENPKNTGRVNPYGQLDRKKTVFLRPPLCRLREALQKKGKMTENISALPSLVLVLVEYET